MFAIMSSVSVRYTVIVQRVANVTRSFYAVDVMPAETRYYIRPIAAAATANVAYDCRRTNGIENICFPFAY